MWSVISAIKLTTPPDVFDMLLILPYAMVPPKELQTVLRKAKEKAEAAEQRREQEKVDAWIRQVPAP
jgi:hypothetical protein